MLVFSVINMHKIVESLEYQENKNFRKATEKKENKAVREKKKFSLK